MGAVNFSLDVHLVERVKEVLPLSIFFETGTFKGDTVNAMLPYFDRFITAELSEPLWKEATDRFAGERKVETYLGNSPDVIAKFRPALKDSSVLYWLDAHWCVADSTSGEQSQCPLLEEIHAIGQLNEESLIIIDDARLFLAPPPEPHEISHWPSIDSIITELRQISSQHELSVVNDVIIFYPKCIHNIVTSYARKHGVDWLRASQSYFENIDLRRSLDEKHAELESMYSSARQLHAQLQEKESQIHTQHANEMDLMAQLEEKEALINVQHANEMDLMAQLEEKQNALENTYSSTLDLQKQLEEKQNALESAYSSILDLQKKCREKDFAIQALAGSLKVVQIFRSIQLRRSRLTHKLRAVFSVRLGLLNQHQPFPLVLPKSHKNPGITRRPPLKISIVTPAFKHATFIECTLKSVLDQQYPALEYFVQDAASEDGTKEILEKYSDRLSGWESIADSGQSHAINLGMQKTTGEIMAWLNSDDILLPGTLAYVSDYFSRHPDVDVIYGHRILINENGQQIGRWMLPKHDNDILSWADFIPQETIFWRRSIWEKAGGKIDESFRFAMDWDLLIRFREAGARFARLPRFLGGFRVHARQKSSAEISGIGVQEMNRIRERVLGRVPSEAEIHMTMVPYLRKHVVTDLWWRILNKSGILS